MIRFSAIVSVVAVALGLLVVGAVSGVLIFVYLAIGLASAALLMLVAGVIIWRDEIFGPTPAHRAEAPSGEMPTARPGGGLIAAPAGGAPAADYAIPGAAPEVGHGTNGRAREQPRPRGAGRAENGGQAPAPGGRPYQAEPAGRRNGGPPAERIGPEGQRPVSDVPSAQPELAPPGHRMRPAESAPLAARGGGAGWFRPARRSATVTEGTGGESAPEVAPEFADTAAPRTGTSAGDAAAETAAAALTVTVVPGIARYHKADCILIRFLGEDDLEAMSQAKAEESGCVPCRACRPEKG